MLVQNVHAFTEEYGVNHPSRPPAENVIIFDEAQRAWHAAKLQRRHKSLALSEPALTLDVMARAAGEWCTIVALVGGGQEIHDGEAGLGEWGRALAASPHQWHVVAPQEALVGGEAVASHRLFDDMQGPPNVSLEENDAMHLSVSVRSPRARQIAEWVDEVLALKPDAARVALKDLTGFRLALTRDLDQARRWLHDASRGELRPGLLATAGSLRHRAYGLEMSQDFQRTYPIADWFLGPSTDVRSSHMLEVAMTEFKCQGLELDWAGLCWGDDLTVGADGASWTMRTFRGTRWQQVTSRTGRQYLINKYRVLLTRAREGMIVWVPPGDAEDPTRDPSVLDRTAEYLRSAGLEEVR
jgi:hypothetical protein